MCRWFESNRGSHKTGIHLNAGFFIYAIRDHGLRESHKTRVLILVHSTKAQNIIKIIVLF